MAGSGEVAGNYRRIVSIAFSGGGTIAQPTSGSIDGTCEFSENAPGVRVASVRCLEKVTYEATAEWEGMTTPVSPGISGDLTFVLQAYDRSTTATVKIVGCISGAPTTNFASMPFKQSQKFTYSGSVAAAENLNPISVG